MADLLLNRSEIQKSSPQKHSPGWRDQREKLGKLIGEPKGPELTTSLGLSTNNSPAPTLPTAPQPSHPPVSHSPGIQSLLPGLIGLVGRIRQDLETNRSKLLTLNPGRRETIAQYLDLLAGQSFQQPLQNWLDEMRTPIQSAALKSYFEEVALIALAQSLLLKTWSDRGLRSFHAADLGKLNWSLNTALKPYLPLDREGWQITRQNHYSWYNPTPEIQRDIWNTLEPWRLGPEDFGILPALIRLTHQSRNTVWGQHYDSRFYSALWNHTSTLGLDQAPTPAGFARKKTAFTPTLKDGSPLEKAPTSLEWIALESHQFQLYVAELMKLWNGFGSPPPLWVGGTGLEVHSRDQLTLGLVNSPKPSFHCRITDMEACDLAFVVEDQVIRGCDKTLVAQRFRQQANSLPYFKKLFGTTTSLGTLQACVAISKLRPGGLLWWAREEPLGPAEGKEALRFFLERGKLISEWNFSGVQHSLPSAVPLFPKYLYLFSRDLSVQSRLEHRPHRVTVQGQIRSHIELPLMLEDSLSLQPAQAGRGHWTTHALQSPSTQRDWLEKWPTPAGQETLELLDRMRAHCVSLAQVGTIRRVLSWEPSGGSSMIPLQKNSAALWLELDPSHEAQKLSVTPVSGDRMPVTKNPGFLISLPHVGWVTPLKYYLESPWVSRWIENHTEQKSGRWLLTEQVVKFIPIPQAFLTLLSRGEKTAKLGTKPGTEVERSPAARFIELTNTLLETREAQRRLLTIVRENGSIQWQRLLDILPNADFASVSMSDQIQISGTLPLHLPVTHMELVKDQAFRSAILLMSEKGAHLKLSSPLPRLVEILWDQLQELQHPTWNELIQCLRVPRRMDLVETTASEMIHSHSLSMNRIRELEAELDNCPLF